MGRGRLTEVTLYTRPGCHLCDEALEGILALRAEVGGFDLAEVNIESDPDLHRRYLERIPVVSVDGDEVSELHFDPRPLRARIATVRPER